MLKRLGKSRAGIYLLGLLSGGVITVLGMLGVQTLEDYTPLFRSDLRVEIAQPPTVEMADTRHEGAEVIQVVKGRVLVRNHALKTDYVADVRAIPLNANFAPEADVVRWDSRPIPAFRTRSVELSIRVRIPVGRINELETLNLQLRLFDSGGKNIGSMQVFLAGKPIPDEA